jgi:ADP-dependent glucokinase
MAVTALKAGTFLASAGILLLALLYRPTPDGSLSARLEAVLAGLVREERQHHVGPSTRVAVGYGACKDLFVKAGQVFEREQHYAKPVHHDDMDTLAQVVDTFAYFFRHGAAAEYGFFFYET